MIVLDASAAISALLNAGPARATLSDQPVHVPHLIDSEIANGLRRLVAAGVVAEPDGRTALDRWRRLGLVRYPTIGLLSRIWELRDSLSAYDAAYVALAEALSCTVVTADARLSRAHGPQCAITVVPR